MLNALAPQSYISD